VSQLKLRLVPKDSLKDEREAKKLAYQLFAEIYHTVIKPFIQALIGNADAREVISKLINDGVTIGTLLRINEQQVKQFIKQVFAQIPELLPLVTDALDNVPDDVVAAYVDEAIEYVKSDDLIQIILSIETGRDWLAQGLIEAWKFLKDIFTCGDFYEAVLS